MQIVRAGADLVGQRAVGIGIAAFGLVGTLLVYRRPKHLLAWLLGGIGGLALLGGSRYRIYISRCGPRVSCSTSIPSRSLPRWRCARWPGRASRLCRPPRRQPAERPMIHP